MDLSTIVDDIKNAPYGCIHCRFQTRDRITAEAHWTGSKQGKGCDPAQLWTAPKRGRR